MWRIGKTFVADAHSITIHYTCSLQMEVNCRKGQSNVHLLAAAQEGLLFTPLPQQLFSAPTSNLELQIRSPPTCLQPMTSGTSMLGSTHCAASSMTTTSNLRLRR